MDRDPGSIRVLHVDDEPDFAKLAASFLEREDDRLDVEPATGSDEGLARLAAEPFDCIVSDYDMPAAPTRTPSSPTGSGTPSDSAGPSGPRHAASGG